MTQSSRMRPTRYAHFEGHTDLCYSDDGRYIITCGSDGEVRVFEGLDDDDCKTHVVADCAHSIAYRDGRFLVGTDSNMVNAFTLEDGSPDGIVTRFTAPATHITVSPGGTLVACAGSDMTIRVHDPIAYRDKEYTGHKAPVLSVALDPKGQFIASSSCDGSVRVWNLETSAVEVSWAVLPQSNSFCNSKTLCRLAFTPSGTLLTVPVGPKVLLYARDGWRLIGELSSDRVKETISIVAVSPCGTLVAGGCVDGTLVVWSLITRGLLMIERHPKGLAYSGVAWNPSTAKKEIAFVDVNGQLGTVVDVPMGGGDGGGGVNGVVESSSAPTLGLENGIGGEDSGEAPFPPLGMDDDRPDDGADEGEDEFSISKIKAELGFADDEEGTFLGLPSSSAAAGTAEVGAGQGGAEGQPSVPAAPRVEGVRLPVVQKPFQPGMSPEHLTERYMLWNGVGVVRQYSGEDESSIDVEFHDSSIHHSLHLNNTAGHSMAALSTQVLALAAESQEDQPSKLVVQQLSGGKEWHVDLSEGEDVLALAVGTGWVAAATDQRNLRVFGTSGTQRELVALPGPVVCLAGHEDMLLVVCHSGVGVAGDQCMSVLVLSIGGEHHPVPQASPLPLSPRAYLAWAGFTDEGTPLTMDSCGVVRLMNYRLGYNWTTILNTRAHVRSKTDHYFLVGASEMQGNVRCVFCKGARFPPILPKPHVSLLNIKLPLCEGDTEKGGLEEQMARTQLMLHTLGQRGTAGDGSSEEEQEAERRLQEAMIKLFALACRSERECRAIEICRLMPSVDTVQLAIRYSAKLHRLALAERLGQVAAAKVEEEGQREERRRRRRMDEEMVRYGQRGGRRGGRRQEEDEEEEEEEEEEDMDHSELPSLTQEEGEEQEEEEEEEKHPKNPLLEASMRRASMSANPSASSLLTKKNPFRKTLPPPPASVTSSSSSSLPSSSSSLSSSSSSRRGIDVIDSFRKAMKKESSSVLRPVVRKTQKRKDVRETERETPPSKAPGKENQVTESQLSLTPSNPFKRPQGRQGDAEEENASTPSTQAASKPRSALQMWMDDNMGDVQAAYPDAEEKELLVKAAVMFKDLDVEVKQKYKMLASSAPSATPAATPTATPTPEEERKRPREEVQDEEEEEGRKKSKGSGLSKLSAFVFAAKDS